MITLAKVALICAIAALWLKSNGKPVIDLDVQVNDNLTVTVGTKKTCILPGGIRLNNKFVIGPF